MRFIKKSKTLFRILSKEGILVTGYKIYMKLSSMRLSLEGYERWIKENEKKEKQIENLEYNPKISVVVPVYNVSKEMLVACINSVLEQSYTNFEICLADDASTMPEVRKALAQYEDNSKVKITYRKENGHISRATNSAIEMADGEYIAFMDCDDMLAPNALYEVVKLLNEDKTLDFIYSDEDKIDENGFRRHEPHFKPDWSPDTMMSLMYTCHLGVYRKEIGDKIGWLRMGVEGAQDYDFTLRFTEQTEKIGHISKILYHWRERKESTAVNPMAKKYIFDAAKKTKEDALKRRHLKGEVELVENVYQFRVNYIPIGNPKVSVIIPSKDNFEIAKRCIQSIIEKTTYKNYEILVIDNGSSMENQKKYESFLKEHNMKYCYEKMEFNFSKMCNRGAMLASGELLLFLNDDMEIVSDTWMERMAGQAMLSHVGAVGAKLLYPNSSLIQHIGVLSLKDGPVHSFCQMDDNAVYYFCRNKIEYNYSAVTAACLMIERSKFEEISGFNEDFAVAYNDVNLCYDLLEKGYYNVARMDAILYHYESLSRGSDTMDSQKYQRLLQERERLYKRHPQLKQKDPFYNKNLTVNRADCSLNIEQKIEKESKIEEITKKQSEAIVQKSNNRLECDVTIIQKEQYIHFLGWCFKNGMLFNNIRNTEIYLIGSKKSYKMKTKKQYRGDISLLANCQGKYNLSGFYALSSKKEIDSGKYKLYIKKMNEIVLVKKEIIL